MSFLARASALRQLKTLTRTITTSVARPAAHNNDDYKPGPYPKTKEERDAAAKKYGLLPSEYEPYPNDDGLGRGDYPKLPDISGDDKDPFYAWDYPEHKRNFGEPMHALSNLIGEDRYNISLRPRYSTKQMLACFLGLLGFLYGTFFLVEPYPVFRPVLEKQLPKPGVVHYTFEPSDSRPEQTSEVSEAPEPVSSTPESDAQQAD